MSKKLMVLAVRPTLPTAKLLAATLGTITNKKVEYGAKYKEGTIAINWGRSNIPHLRHGVVCINPPGAVVRAVSKSLALRAFHNSKIATPKTGALDHKRWDFTMDDFPLLMRTEQHTRGDDIVIAYNFKQFMDNIHTNKFTHWTKLILDTTEYRVHVVLGKKFLQKKFLANVDANNPLQGIIKNYTNGWRFARRNINQYASYGEMAELAERAIEVLGLDFGAVDIVRSKGQSYVLEVNTAPALSEEGFLADYAEAIVEYVSHIEPINKEYEAAMLEKIKSIPTIVELETLTNRISRNYSTNSLPLPYSIDRAYFERLSVLQPQTPNNWWVTTNSS